MSRRRQPARKAGARARGAQDASESENASDGSDEDAQSVHYDVTALPFTIYYNREGDHDHNGLMFALSANVPILKYIRALGRSEPPTGPQDMAETFLAAARARAEQIGVELPVTPAQARQPHPLVRPLVLRARLGERVSVKLENEIPRRHVGLHLVGGGYDVRTSDGSQVGRNPPSLVAGPGAPPLDDEAGFDGVYHWACEHEGVFPFHDGGDYSGGEDGSNVHGLFGALIVEPPGATWRDPVTGRGSHGDDGAGPFEQLDGLELDVLPPGVAPDQTPPAVPGSTLGTHDWGPLEERADFATTAHRELVIVFHDEPEFVPPHGHRAASPCEGNGNGGHGGAGHGGNGRNGGNGNGGGHGDVLPIMPVSYRAEPMINREHRLWQLIRNGHDFRGRPVLNEEQHHSSWMFGDPATPVFKAYLGDPIRVRFVHAGIKETHVFHLHLYEWFAVAGDPTSARIDAISVSPQTGHTIEPAWGAGNRQRIAADVIWHCHLYPHFHEGMWGMLRTFETRQDGIDGELLADQAPPYTGRRIGRYPDGTRIERLLPLPDRPSPPSPTPDEPGFPLYIPGEIRQKSPIPPWPDREVSDEEAAEALPPHVTSLLAADMPLDFDYRPVPTELERRAFNERPVPGELFTRNPMRRQLDEIYDPASATDPDPRRVALHHAVRRNTTREVFHDVVVAMRDVVYNSHGWHDKHGHLYYLEAEGDPALRPGPIEPLFFRANHGQIVNLTLRNALPETIEGTEFDHAFPPCPALPWQGECAPHVHMVKFDSACADGASVGWNYLSGPVLGKKMVYRWWADQEFGTIFFHDHLFANHRQKHGLFGALLVEPAGSTFWHPLEADRRIVSGAQAMIERHPENTDDNPDPQGRMWFRELCLAIGDFIPMWDRQGQPLNPPAVPGGHGDQGVMALNYRSAPLRERPGDPAYWFSSRAHGDPDTTLFRTYAGDPVWFRVVQGSHEEQHSLQVHGMRWRRFRANLDSAIRNQQSFGISEAFTFINQVPFGEGDYLYKLSGIDDLWLGCWGLIRAFKRPDRARGEQLDLPTRDASPWADPEAGARPPVRRFMITAEPQALVYRRPDLVDPFGLVYRLTAMQGPDDRGPIRVGPGEGSVEEPLVLWCREGERVVVELTNGLPPRPARLEPEPFAPEVPVDRADRMVSSQVSMHADLVRYDVRHSDGANAGFNPPQTIHPGERRAYSWDTARPEGHPDGEPLGPVLLQDMADVRNHRHHGLIGALVVLPADATPHAVGPGASTALVEAPIWHGARVTVVRAGKDVPVEDQQVEHAVVLMQDGLRLFLHGNVGFPLPDPPDEEAGEAEAEDQGQKGVNYRSEPIGPVFDPKGSPYSLARPDPATPVWHVNAGQRVRLHVVGALDKPRQYSFTVHGVVWPEHRFASPAGDVEQLVGSESAFSTGSVRTLVFTPGAPGDHAYRAGVLRWALAQGMWGILRVE
jgi:manganese oxidase